MALQSQYEDFKKVMVYTMLPIQSTNKICKEKWGLEKKSAVITRGGERHSGEEDKNLTN